MRVVVCVKQVPDIQGERSFGPAGRVVRGSGDLLNDLDENAVEAALTLAEERGGEVVALTVGPASATSALRRALQLGVTAGVHVRDERIAGADVLGTAAVLAAAIRVLEREAPVDLVVTGMAALDGLTSAVPGALAAMLGIPAATLAAEATIAGRTLRVRREVGDSREILEADLPALLSVTDQSFEARFPTPAAIVAARTAPIRVLDLDDLGLDPALMPARARIDGARVRPARVPGEVVTDDGDGGRRLVEFLAARGFL